MGSPPNALVELSIEVGSEPITGSVAVGDQEPRPFSGWIELASVLEAARCDGGSAAGAQNSGVFPWGERRAGLVTYE